MQIEIQSAFRISAQTDETLFGPTTPYIVGSFCFRLHVAEGFDRFQTLRNNTQQHATGCANGRNSVTDNNVVPVCSELL